MAAFETSDRTVLVVERSQSVTPTFFENRTDTSPDMMKVKDSDRVSVGNVVDEASKEETIKNVNKKKESPYFMKEVKDGQKVSVGSEVDVFVEGLKEETLQINCFGTRKTCNRLSRVEITFLVIFELAMLITVGFSIERIVYLHDSNNPVVTFAWIIFINTIFCMVYGPVGVFYQRYPEILVVLTVFGTTAIIFIVDVAKRRSGHNDLYWVRFGIFWGCFVFVVILATMCCLNYWKKDDLPFRSAAGPGPTANKKAQDHFLMRSYFRSFVLMDLQITFTMIPLTWPEGEHFATATRILVITAVIAAVLMSASGLYIAQSTSKQQEISFLYFPSWIALLIFAGVLLVLAIKELMSKDPKLAMDGINTIAVVTTSISLVLRVLTAVILYKMLRGLGKDFHQQSKEENIARENNYQTF